MSVQQKINYDLWANERVLKALKKISSEKILSECARLFAHLFKAQAIWFNRVYAINEKVEIWGDYTLNECVPLLNDSSAMLKGIASKVKEECSYIDTKGNSYTNKVSDIFEHMIIHGEHHRAQILSILRKTGLTPPSTDYIFYLRSLQS